MVRFWCEQCNDGHDNARDCPARQSLRPLKGEAAKKLKDHAKRSEKADYRAPKGKGYKNAVEDSCVLILLALAAVPTGITWAVIELLF